ncbi:MAG: hypothetical protein ABI143_13415 [Caldimonas sp.]
MPVPTLWGTAVLLVVTVAAAMAWGRWIGDHLAASAPALGPDGQGAHTLVVEGWLGEAQLDVVIATLRRRHYDRIVVSGGPFEDWREERRFPTYAERAADYLQRRGTGATPVIAAPAPASAQDRSYLSAVMVREWAEKAGVKLDAVDLYSAGVHARRSGIVYRMAFGDEVEVGVLAAPTIDYDPERWWKTSAGAKAVMGEALSVAWTRCCFWPAAHGSFSERWAVPEPSR